MKSMSVLRAKLIPPETLQDEKSEGFKSDTDSSSDTAERNARAVSEWG